MQIIPMSGKFCDVKKSGHVYCQELRLQKVRYLGSFSWRQGQTSGKEGQSCCNWDI